MFILLEGPVVSKEVLLTYKDVELKADSIAHLRFDIEKELTSISSKPRKITFSFIVPSYEYIYQRVYYPGSPVPVDEERQYNIKSVVLNAENLIPFLDLKGSFYFDSHGFESNIYESESNYWSGAAFQLSRQFLKKDPHFLEDLVRRCQASCDSLRNEQKIKDFVREALDAYAEAWVYKKLCDFVNLPLPLDKINDVVEESRAKGLVSSEEYVSLKSMVMELKFKGLEFSREYERCLVLLEDMLDLSGKITIGDSTCTLDSIYYRISQYLPFLIDSVEVQLQYYGWENAVNAKRPGVILALHSSFMGFGENSIEAIRGVRFDRAGFSLNFEIPIGGLDFSKWSLPERFLSVELFQTERDRENELLRKLREYNGYREELRELEPLAQEAYKLREIYEELTFSSYMSTKEILEGFVRIVSRCEEYMFIYLNAMKMKNELLCSKRG